MKYAANKMTKPNHPSHRKSLLRHSNKLKCVPTIYFCVHLTVDSFIKGECDINDEHEGTDMLLLALKIISLPVPVLKDISKAFLKV